VWIGNRHGPRRVQKIRGISPQEVLRAARSHTDAYDRDRSPVTRFQFQRRRYHSDPQPEPDTVASSSHPLRAAPHRRSLAGLASRGVKKSGAVLALGTPRPPALLFSGRRAPLRLLRAGKSSQPLRDRDAERGKASRRPSTAASLPLLSAPAYPRPAPPAPRPSPRRRTMSTSPASASAAAAAAASPPAADEAARATETVVVDERVASHVDPFLVEALDNPRHRLMGTCRAAPCLFAHHIASCACDFGVVGSCLCGCDGCCGFASVGGGIWARIPAPCP
jgi:hypothetical protein